MSRNRDACGCSGDEDDGGFDDLIDTTPPDGFYSPEVGSPRSFSGLVQGTPQGRLSIPAINVDMYYDSQGNVVSDDQRYTEAEQDFLNRTIQSPESQGRKSSGSSYGLESPPGFQYKKGRKAGLWNGGNGSRSGTACGGGSPSDIDSSPEGFQYKKGRKAQLWGNNSNNDIDSTPEGFQYKKGRKAQLWGNEDRDGGSRPSTSPAGLASTPRNDRPLYARPRAGQPSLIPVPAPRSGRSLYQDTSAGYEEPTQDYGGGRPSRSPINYQQQNIDNLKKYPDPRYTYIPNPNTNYPGGIRAPPGAQRRSEPVRLRHDMSADDLDVSSIPVATNIRPHHKQSGEQLMSGMISHTCGNRGLSGARARPPIPGINQSVYGGKFACPALENANTWLPNDSADDDIQVIHSPRPGSDLQDDDDDMASFEANERLCNNASTASRASKKSQQSPELIDLCDCSGEKTPNKSKKSLHSSDLIDLTTPSPKSTKGRNQSIFEDMEKEVLEEESYGQWPNYSDLSSSVMEDTADGVPDLSRIEKLVREENNDVSAAVGLSMPSRVNTVLSRSSANVTANSAREGNRNIPALNRPSTYASKGITHDGTINISSGSDSSKNISTVGKSTAGIPVMPEDRDFDHVFAANMTMVQEQGLSLSSPPHQIANLLFPPDDGECQIVAIIDSVPLEGAIVPTRPSRIKLPPSSPEKMDELAVIADSFISSAPDRMAGTHLNATLGTNLNVTFVDLVTPDTSLDESGTRAGTAKESVAVQGTRSISAINSGRLVGETDFIMDPGPRTGTWIQLRGHREPNWFPGYYASLPSLPNRVNLMRTASEVLPRAWYAAQSDSFQEENQLTFSA